MTEDSGQRSIPRHKITRAATLAKAGARVGVNYARYYGRRALTGVDDRDGLHRMNAEDTYASFSKLKGGPLKVAQMLSIDQNILPVAYQEQFSRAQYSAPPLSYPLVVRTFRQEFGVAPTDIFDTFTRSAVNAASIGQVHKAMKDGVAYAVKVQYPGVADSLKSDLRLVKPIAVRMIGLSPKDVDYYFQEIEERLLEETDYRLELQRSMELTQLSEGLRNIRFPRYFPQYSSPRILTMEWIDGVPFDVYAKSDKLSAAQRNHLGQALWDFYHFQIHNLKEFHADPHPGNFLVADDELYVLDFGCVKKLDEGFYQQYFQLLDQSSILDDVALTRLLEAIGLIQEKDSAADRRILLNLYRESIELLGRPFQRDVFDFGDTSYVNEIYAFGERTKKNPDIKRINTARGSRHALYLNRAYFGLYNLLASLGAEIRAEMPDSLSGNALSARPS